MWSSRHYPFPSLADVVKAKPTAELEPITESYTQTDEEDMGMTYAELGIFGRLRKIYRCGPVSMYQKLVAMWTHAGLPPSAYTAEARAEELREKQGGGQAAASTATATGSATKEEAQSHSLPPQQQSVVLSPQTVSTKVQRFFYYYSVNRHKLTTLTPSYHAVRHHRCLNKTDTVIAARASALTLTLTLSCFLREC